MKCSKCGADNPDSAEFCSLCAERIQPAQGGAKPALGRMERPPGSEYMAPGEWRGDAETLRPTVSKVVEKKVRRFRWKMIAYTVLLVAIITWLVLSFTLWGNPSPSQVSMRLIKAANERDPDAFTELFQEQNRVSAQDMYTRVITYLGSSGRFNDIRLEVDQASSYEAYSYIESGNITTAGGSSVSVSRSDNLIITLESRGGAWYVSPTGTDIIP